MLDRFGDDWLQQNNCGGVDRVRQDYPTTDPATSMTGIHLSSTESNMGRRQQHNFSKMPLLWRFPIYRRTAQACCTKWWSGPSRTAQHHSGRTLVKASPMLSPLAYSLILATSWALDHHTALSLLFQARCHTTIRDFLGCPHGHFQGCR
jgi:hypothetical protein